MNNTTDPGLTPLDQALALARLQLQAQPLPAGLAAQVQARVKSARTPRPTPHATPQPHAGAAWWGAAACALLLVGSVVLMLDNPLNNPPGAPQAGGGERMAGFMPLVPEEDWPRGNAPAWLVNTELRRDRLVALGLPFDPARAGDSVRAELLVRPSGEVLAVRFLQ